jgi:hypothetical protein
MTMWVWIACAALLAFTFAAVVVNGIESDNHDGLSFGLMLPVATFTAGVALFAAAAYLTAH